MQWVIKITIRKKQRNKQWTPQSQRIYFVICNSFAAIRLTIPIPMLLSLVAYDVVHDVCFSTWNLFQITHIRYLYLQEIIYTQKFRSYFLELVRSTYFCDVWLDWPLHHKKIINFISLNACLEYQPLENKLN